MAPTALIGKVTSRGQVTIPQVLRESAGIQPNGYVVFQQLGARVVLGKADQRALSWDELTAPIREAAKRQKLSRKDILADIKFILLFICLRDTQANLFCLLGFYTPGTGNP